MQPPLQTGPGGPKQLPRCFFITKNTDQPYAANPSDQDGRSDAGSCEETAEDLMPLLFWPPSQLFKASKPRLEPREMVGTWESSAVNVLAAPSAAAAASAEKDPSFDWDPGSLFRRSDSSSIFVADDVQVSLANLVNHYSQIGHSLFDPSSRDSNDDKDQSSASGKMTSIVFNPYRFCILNTGNFSWCYVGYLTDAAIMLQSQLQMLHSAITFYIGPLPSLVEEFSVTSASQMRQLINQRLLAAGIDDKNVVASGFCSTFFHSMHSRNPIPLTSAVPTFSWYLPPHTVTPTSRLFLEASQILNRFNSSARKDRFVYGGCIFVDTAQRIPGHRSSERNFNLLFTNLDMNITRYLHHEVDRRVPKPTYAQPRWIPASLLLDANIELATQDDEIPVWDDSQRKEGSSQRSPLMQSMMRPQNDGIDDVTGFLGTASIAAAHSHSPVRRPEMQPPLQKKSDGRWIGLFSLECGSVRLVMLVTMRSVNEGHLMERLIRGLTPQLESVRRIFDEHRRQDISMIQERDEHHRGTAQEEDENYLDCHWVFDSNLCRELHSQNMADAAAESAVQRFLPPISFSNSIAHINSMFNRDPGLSRVIVRSKVGHVYSRRTFGIQAYFQLCIPDSLWVDSLIESRLEESVASYFEDKGQLVGWI